MTTTHNDGFYQTPNRLILDYGPQIGVYGVAVYSVLLAHRNQETGTCFPSYARIAELLGCDRKSVMRAVKKLAEAGLIVIERHRDERGHTNNTYRPKLTVDASTSRKPKAAQRQPKAEPTQPESRPLRLFEPRTDGRGEVYDWLAGLEDD